MDLLTLLNLTNSKENIVDSANITKVNTNYSRWSIKESTGLIHTRHWCVFHLGKFLRERRVFENTSTAPVGLTVDISNDKGTPSF